jgi:hypothetical protein
MKNQETNIYKILISNKKIQQYSNVMEIFSFLCGYTVAESFLLKFGQTGHSYWVSDFEEFATNYLNSELNNFNDEWTETIGTSYAKWIYQNQEHNEDGLDKFYKILDLFILSVKEEK